jgi:hypothetical protein
MHNEGICMGATSVMWRSGTLPAQHPARMFLPLLRSAVAAQPGRLDLLRDLAVALRDDRRWTEIVDLLDSLRQSGGLNPELAFELGSAARGAAARIHCFRPMATSLRSLGARLSALAF